MDAKNFSSSYRFEPKAPDSWSVKEYNRNNKKVKLIKLKPWQLDAHLTLRDANFGMLKAFCGCGKTIAARSIGAYRAYTKGKRQVYCVPKNDIGNDGFAGYFDIEIPWRNAKKRKSTSKTLCCDSPINFCDSSAESKVDELIRLLSQKPIIDDCAAENQILATQQIVCTQQCLVLAVRKIKDNPNDYPEDILDIIISYNTFWIDEAHHIKGHDESEEEKMTMNLLGKFVNYVLEKKDIGAELFVMTATPYRGDNSRLFSLKQLDDFATYSLDFLEYFPTLGISRVDMELEEYTDVYDVAKRVCHNIGEEVDRHHVVIVPPTGRKWRKKKDDVNILFDLIYKTLMQKLNIDLEEAKYRVNDLVTESTQVANDKLLRQEPKSGETHPPRFNVVVACMKLREGSDLCTADRLHNTSMEDSPPINFQTNGRLFRHFPGKDNVKIRYYVEKFKTISSGKREFVSDRVNSILHYMLMDDLLNPILVNIPPFVCAEKKNKKLVKRKYTTLEDIFGNQYQDMKKYILTSMSDFDFNEKSVNNVIEDTIQKYIPNDRNFTKGQVTEVKLALKAFLLRSRSGELRSKGVDASFIRKNGFDVIVEDNNLHGNMYTANLNQKEFERFRDTIKKLEWTEEQKEQIECGILRSAGVKNKPELDKRGRYILPLEKLAACHQIGTMLKKFHTAYRKVYERCLSSSVGFTVDDLALELNLKQEFVLEKLLILNKILPKGYEFNFEKDSKLAAKLPIREAA